MGDPDRTMEVLVKESQNLRDELLRTAARLEMFAGVLAMKVDQLQRAVAEGGSGDDSE
jgi:hypothetical protein